MFNQRVTPLYLVTFLFFIGACKPVSNSETDVSMSNSVFQCVASQSQCEISSQGIRFTLKFSQQNLLDKLTTEVPFSMELSQILEEPSKKITQVSAFLEGKDMFMGKIPMQFSQVSEIDGKYFSTAKSMVGACTTDKMLWRFDIVVEVEGTPVNLHYDFLIIR